MTRELYKRTRPLSETERRVWLLDGAINRRGMRVDGPSIRAALHMAEQLRAQYDAQMRELTGGAVASCNALGALKAWLAGHGLPGVQADLSKQVVAELLTRDYLTPEVRRALSLRQEAARASTAKLVPMANMAGEDGRLRHLFQYHGAATGRWAGRKVQPQNLPRDVPDADTVERILAHVRRGEYAEIAAAYGSPMAALSRCMRGLIVPAPGHCLVGGDYSAIEGRGTAWLAGEDWKLRTFWSADAGTGPGVYEATAGKILGIPPEQVTPAQRQAYGKVPELALGYQGGVGAFRIMARTYGVQISESEARDIIQRWRAEHPKTQQLWRDLERAAIHAVQNKGEVYSAGAPGRQIRFKAVGQFLWCRLPSGRVLCYPYPKLLPGAYGEQLTYMTALSQADKAKIIADQANSTTWARVSTYGGSLTENVVQAVCRDLLAAAMLRLDAHGYNIILHVHDEIVCEVPGSVENSAAQVEKMTAIMNQVPGWAADFPVKVQCEAMARYGV